MIAQVALTVICIPPAMGISEEAWRDRVIRGTIPRRAVPRRAGRRGSGSGSRHAAARSPRRRSRRGSSRPTASSSGASRRNRASRRSHSPTAYPAWASAVRSAEVEVSAGAPPRSVANMWTAAVGPRFFEAFDVPIVAGRDFHDGDRAAGAHTVLVNQKFARRYHERRESGRTARALCRRGAAATQPWLEIVGMVRDIGMTPTDLGEAPYVFRAASLRDRSPIVMGVRMTGDPAALAPRVRVDCGRPRSRPAARRGAAARRPRLAVRICRRRRRRECTRRRRRARRCSCRRRGSSR